MPSLLDDFQFVICFIFFYNPSRIGLYCKLLTEFSPTFEYMFRTFEKRSAQTLVISFVSVKKLPLEAMGVEAFDIVPKIPLRF